MRIYALKPSLSLETSIECELLRTLKPHTSPVVTSAIDRTGTLLATGGADGIVKVWDIRGGFVTHTFHGHNGVISSLKFFELDTSIQQTEAASKKRKRKGQEHEETESQTNSESTLGFRLASGGEDGKVRIWNLHKRTSTAVLDSHVSVVRCLDYSPEENALLSASRDKTVIVWDVRTGKMRSTIPVLEEVESSGFLKDGTFVYTGGETARLRLWTTDKPREITQEQPVGTENEAMQEVMYHRGLGFLLSVHADQTLLFHSLLPLETVTSEDTIPPLPILRRVSGTYGQVIDIAYVGSAKDFLALATNDEAVRVVSLSSAPNAGEAHLGEGSYFGAEVGLLKGHSDIVICIDVDWSGHWLASGAKDNAARLWRLDPASDSYTCYAVFTGHAESLGAVALPHIVPAAGSAAYDDPLSHPPSFLITGSQDRTVKHWEIPNPSKENDGKKPTPRATYTRKAHDKDINAIATSPSGHLFASASQDRTVKIWTAEDGSTIGVLRGHRRGVWSVAFSPQSTNLHISGANSGGNSRGYVLTGSADKTVRIWSLLDYSCLMTMEGHTNSVLKVLWLPPGTNEEEGQHDKRGPLVGSAGGDGLVKIWEAQSGECAATLDNHADRVWALAVRPPTAPTSTIDEFLISGAGDGVITFWKDTTNATAEEARVQESRRVELDQTLSNYIHGGNWRDAIVLALQLDQPGKLLSLFKSVVEAETFERDSWTGKKEVDDVIASLADEQIYRLLLRCRDWNTNARNALVAQRVLRAIVENFDGERLSNLRVRRQKGRTTSLREVLEGLRAYSERHFNRVSDLCDESFLLEFTLREMDEVIGPDVNGSSKAEDVLMLE